jgi:hypothetical protein
MIVAETKKKLSCDQEDLTILGSNYPDSTQVTYILSLGVSKEYRRAGIGNPYLIFSKTKSLIIQVLSFNIIRYTSVSFKLIN